MSRKLKIGILEYGNIAPLLAAMPPLDRFQFVPGVPSQLNQWLLRGSLDAGFVSTAQWCTHRSLLTHAGGVGIVSHGSVESVVLLGTRAPLEELIAGTTPLAVHVTPASATSVALTRILAREFWTWGNRVTFVKNLKFANLRLLIGDEALIANQSSTESLLDLGEEWLAFSGESMVWAIFCIRRGFPISEFQDLVDSLRRAAGAPDRTGVAPGLALRLGIDLEATRSYLDRIRYEIDTSAVVGLETFCRAQGRIPTKTPSSVIEA